MLTPKTTSGTPVRSRPVSGERNGALLGRGKMRVACYTELLNQY